MKYQLQILIFVLLCLVGKLDASSLYDYGLHLKSHTVSAIERTSLFLDDNQPFTFINRSQAFNNLTIGRNHVSSLTNKYISFLQL